MDIKAIFTSAFWLRVIFIASLFVLFFIVSVSYKHSLDISQSAKEVVKSYQARVELEQLISYVKDAETGQRGYIITHDTVFLAPYIHARPKVNKSLHSLKILFADNLQQQKNLDSIYHLINMRFAMLEIALKISNSKKVDLNRLNIDMLQGKNKMDEIRMKVKNMVALEGNTLKIRQVSYENNNAITPVFTATLLLFTLFVVIFSYVKINNDLSTMKRIYKELLITIESFKDAEEIGGFSSWRWDLESNKLTYSDNQYRLLGCPPQSFEPTMEKFLEFVHPDDKHIITEGENLVLNESKTSVAQFRIIRQDGELRYFKSIGKLLTDIDGKKIIIGLNSDITEQYLIGLELKERNLSLERSNLELASFNHIASHDLQEPLRKIQIFISRISENEMTGLSEKGKDYFSKIQKSASRMRALIDDLLLFSSINRSKRDFVRTDLNQILQNVKQDLSASIEEKKASIISATLPNLRVIPSQIQQLFQNIIGNAIKYSKPGIPPVIKIYAEKITSSKASYLKSDLNQNCYKISFVDNGLGFEPKDAENIFVLFTRLHHTNEYQGTGIGLAICKKIVENHEGSIKAEGKPDIGSTFAVFLPE